MSDSCPVVGRKDQNRCPFCKRIVAADMAECDACAEVRRALNEMAIESPAPAREIPDNLKLDIGGGAVSEREGFMSIDRRAGLEAFPLDFPDNVAEEIVASHVLEHFSKRDTAAVLAEWVRVLKPGGTIRLAVPNLEWILKHPEHPHFEGYIVGGQTDENDYHHALFTEAKLRRLMEAAGLVDIFPWTSDIEDCASLEVSLNLMGTKPGPAVPLDLSAVRVVGCLSAPRVGFNDTWGCIATVLAEWGIPMLPHRGALWEQVMQNMLISAVEGGYDFAVCFDYDSAFRRSDFAALLSYIIQHPEVDAVAPFQPMRERANTALCGLKTAPQGAHETISASKPIEALTAHFGCTIFRVSRLKGIPLPWLWSQPGKTGKWTIEDGKVDADCYFWEKFQAAGRKLHVLPWVCIGHIEPMITMLGHQKDEKTGQMVTRTISMHSSAWMNRVFAETQPGVKP